MARLRSGKMRDALQLESESWNGGNQDVEHDLPLLENTPWVGNKDVGAVAGVRKSSSG